MKQTFLEKFGTLYAYPYPGSFTEKASKALIDDQDPVSDQMLDH